MPTVSGIPTLQHALLKANEGALHLSHVPTVAVGLVAPSDSPVLVRDTANPDHLYITIGTNSPLDYLYVGGLKQVSWGDIDGNLEDQTDISLKSLGAQPEAIELDTLSSFTNEMGFLFRNSNGTYTFITNISGSGGGVLQREAIALDNFDAGDYVNLLSSGNATQARLADGPNNIPAHGFVKNNFLIDETALVYGETESNNFVSGAENVVHYLGANGKVTAAIPTTGIYQHLGKFVNGILNRIDQPIFIEL